LGLDTTNLIPAIAGAKVAPKFTKLLKSMDNVGSHIGKDIKEAKKLQKGRFLKGRRRY